MSNVEAKDDRLLDTAYMEKKQLQSILLLDHSNGKKETHVSTEQTRNKHIRKKVRRKGDIDEKVEIASTSHRKTHDGGDDDPSSDGSDSDGNGDSDRNSRRGSRRDKGKKRRDVDGDPSSDNEST
jgi:hypothetical protein